MRMHFKTMPINDSILDPLQLSSTTQAKFFLLVES
jgi:hypothetical protein